MAMHDLAQDLDRDNIRLDGEIERRVVAMILKHLEDPGTDVKQQAVRTIASLARKVQETQLEEIAEKLATHILNNQDEEKRDIGSIGLKTLVGVLTQQTAPAVLKRVTPKLQQGITQSTEVVHYCLEILNDLLKGFGMIMVRDLGAIQSGILPLLSSDIPATRKRASTCVASLAICAPDQLFNTLVGSIFSNIETCKNADQIRTYIQTIAGISRTVGHRLGRELKRIIPLFMALCKDTQHQEDVEMLENCLQAFDSFVQRCPKEIGQHLDEIVATALRYIKFDPNYADEEEEDDAMDEVPPAARRPPPAARRPPAAHVSRAQDEDEDEEYSDDGDYSGDDDSSWKVRSAAVKCLAAVIRCGEALLPSLRDCQAEPCSSVRVPPPSSGPALNLTGERPRRAGRTRPEMLQSLYQSVLPVLIARFREREEIVKMEVFSAFKDLLRQSQGKLEQALKTGDDDAMLLSTTASSLSQLLDVDKVMKAVSKQLKEKSVKTKERCLELLRELILVLNGGIGPYLASLIPDLETSIAKNAKTSLKVLPPPETPARGILRPPLGGAESGRKGGRGASAPCFLSVWVLHHVSIAGLRFLSERPLKQRGRAQPAVSDCANAPPGARDAQSFLLGDITHLAARSRRPLISGLVTFAAHGGPPPSPE